MVYFVFKLFTSLYLIMSSIYTLRHLCSFMTTYYFNIVSIGLEIVLLLSLVLYSSKNNFKCLSAMSIIIGMYTLIELIIYTFTGIEFNLFVIDFSLSFSLSDTVELIIYLSLFVVDMLLLMIHSDEAIEPIKKKHLLLFAFIASLFNIIEKVKMCMTLGPIITMFNFPSFETWRLSSLSFIKESIDFIPLIGWVMIVFVRLSLSLFLLNKLWGVNKKSFNIPVLIFIGFITYIISMNYEMSKVIYKDAYIFLFIAGIIPFILLFLMLRKGKGRLERVK